jgi:hypothetical protein
MVRRGWIPEAQIRGKLDELAGQINFGVRHDS